MKTHPHTRTPAEASSSVGVEISGLQKSYRTGGGVIHAVRDLDVSIGAGETVALLGPNGAGKSTTIDILLALTRPDAGTVSIFGRSPAEAIAAGAVGAMLQTGGLVRYLSVRELIELVAALYPNPLGVDEVLELTGLTNIAGQRTEKLSGGQTQRARAALALVSDPELLVLDEPTVAMDVEARHAFWTAMRAFAARGKTVLFATHYLEEADAYADRAVLMNDGRVIADGPTTKIKALVRSHRIRATLPGASTDELSRLPGVSSAELPRRRNHARLRRLGRGHPRAPRTLPASTRHRGQGRRTRGSLPRADPPHQRHTSHASTGGSTMNGSNRMPAPGWAFTRSELRRLLRNRRFFLFSLGFPLALYFLIATPNRHEHDLGGSGIPAPLYLMVGLVAFGTMNGVMGSGARIAAERVLGWNRQLRLTPLRARTYFASKVVSAYVTALITIAVLYASGLSLGVQPLGADLGRDDRAAAGRADPVRSPRRRHGPPRQQRLDRAGHRRTDRAVRHARRRLVPDRERQRPAHDRRRDAFLLARAGEQARRRRPRLAGSGWLVIGLWTLGAVGLARWAYRRDTQRT